MSLEAFPLKLFVYLSLLIVGAAYYPIRQATQFGILGSDALHRALGVVMASALMSAAIFFELHLLVKHGWKAAAVLSPFFVVVVLGGAYVTFQIVFRGREGARSMLSSLSKKGLPQ